ncbi:hypothetical protein JKF63_05046 [Porcisia hertigi]|uniref:Uncharacterized protein n=1 Tax=Porcisia hertigi TaxID=2761500 RepID=A0A836I6S6_9TRYP|nr:hypothetical protein JKF63_05046 [Porcisia hertigi]
MDFQFISDSDLLHPIASVVVAAVLALFIGSCIAREGASNSRKSESGDRREIIQKWTGPSL